MSLELSSENIDFFFSHEPNKVSLLSWSKLSKNVFIIASNCCVRVNYATVSFTITTYCDAILRICLPACSHQRVDELRTVLGRNEQDALQYQFDNLYTHIMIL